MFHIKRNTHGLNFKYNNIQIKKLERTAGNVKCIRIFIARNYVQRTTLISSRLSSPCAIIVNLSV